MECASCSSSGITHSKNESNFKLESEHSLSHSTVSDLLGLEAFLHPTLIGAVCDVLRMADARRETFIYKLEMIAHNRNASECLITSEFSHPYMPSPDDSLRANLNIDNSVVKDLFIIGLPLYGSWEEGEVVMFPGFTAFIPTDSNPKTTWLTMYVQFPKELPMEAEDFSEAMSALLELAQDVLACRTISIVIDQDAEEVPEIVHTLQYVGFNSSPENAIPGVILLRYDFDNN